MTDAASPLARRIVTAITRLGAGNGLASKDVRLIREENGRFTLNGLLSAQLIALRTTREDSGRPSKAHVFENAQALEEEIGRACTELAKSADIQAVLRTKLIDRPGHGFGAADIQIPVPALAYDFAHLKLCPTCQGKGRGGCPVCQGRARVACPQCRGQREEWCGQCRGTGHQNGEPNAPNCTWCEGIGRTRCLRCTGSGEIGCQACNASGNTNCQACRGAGEMASVTHLTFAWRCLFQNDVRDAPPAINHLLSKAPVLRLVEAGHIAPKAPGAGSVTPPVRAEDPTDVQPVGAPATMYWPMSADVPWCEATIKLGNAAPFIATAAGSKGRINHCPNFLDKLLPKARRLEDQALSLMLRMGAKRADRELAKAYPIGLSEKARRHVLKGARDTIRAKLRVQLLIAWFLSCTIPPGLAWLIGGVHGAAIAALIGVGVFQGVLLYGQARFAKEAGIAYKPRPKFGWEALAILICALAGTAARIVLT